MKSNLLAFRLSEPFDVEEAVISHSYNPTEQRSVWSAGDAVLGGTSPISCTANNPGKRCIRVSATRLSCNSGTLGRNCDINND